jgi:hypothetical protein
VLLSIWKVVDFGVAFIWNSPFSGNYYISSSFGLLKFSDLSVHLLVLCRSDWKQLLP